MTRDPETGVHTLILYGPGPNGGAQGNCTAAEQTAPPGLPRGVCSDRTVGAALEAVDLPPWHPGPPNQTGSPGVLCITCTCATVWQSRDGATPNSFTPVHPPGTCAYYDHDDANLLPETVNGTLVNFQIVKQAWPTPAQLQPEMLNVRRVVGPRLSRDGRIGSWGEPRSVMLPDDQDPPELEFYQLRSHILGRSGRLVGTALLYAPSPWINDEYARLSDIGCRPSPREHDCHGPHMYYEYWIGPDASTGGDVTNVSSWQRPFRDTIATSGVFAPALTTNTCGPQVLLVYVLEACATLSTLCCFSCRSLANQTASYRRHHVFASLQGGAASVPLYRIAGIHAPANGEFSTRPFVMPAAGLWLNADAHWTLPPHVYMVEQGDAGPDCKVCSKTCLRACFGKHKCDIGCQAYIMAELQDAVRTVASCRRALFSLLNIKCAHRS
eukprot:COSAG02_NODE_6023_length_3869_cov_1.528382_2_plen_440_part_00